MSGGHTHLFRSGGPCDHVVLGATLDDAAGEAFDKVAAMLRLSYPGGPAVEKLAREGDPARVPVQAAGDAGRFARLSFSGLKTAVRYRCFGQHEDGRPRSELLPGVRPADVAASFQAAVVDSLAMKVAAAVRKTGIRRVAVGGGVACNGPLRERCAPRRRAAGSISSSLRRTSAPTTPRWSRRRARSCTRSGARTRCR